MSNGISGRQLCTAGFTGLLPLSAAAAWADWRGALLAVPAVILATWAAASAGERTGGMLKVKGGKLLALLYIVWGEFAAGTVLALSGLRISAAGGQTEAFWPTVLAALPVFCLAMGKPEAFARAAEIFYLAMLAVLVLVLLLGAGQVEWRWLLVRGESLTHSALTAMGLGCTGVYALLLWNGGGKEGKKHFLIWSAVSGLVLAGMAALTVGSLSPALANTVERPFFLMTVGLGRTARTESLVALLWLAADVTLLGLLAQTGRGLWQDVLALKGEKWAGAGFSAVALGLALGLERFGEPERLLREIIPLGGLVLGGAVPVLLWGLGKMRERTGEDAISCGDESQMDQIYYASKGEEKKLKKMKKRG